MEGRFIEKVNRKNRVWCLESSIFELDIMKGLELLVMIRFRVCYGNG